MKCILPQNRSSLQASSLANEETGPALLLGWQMPSGLNAGNRVCALTPVPMLMGTSVQQRGPGSISSRGRAHRNMATGGQFSLFAPASRHQSPRNVARVCALCLLGARN